MTKDKFEEIFNARIAKLKDLLITKADEYANDIDRLHNFNVGSRITGDSPPRVLDGFLMKHYISYRDMLNDIDNNQQIPLSRFDEKLGDIITYFILQEAVMLDTGLIKSNGN